MPVLTPSQIAAQAAFSHMNLNMGNQSRRRSQTVPVPEGPTDGRRNSKGSTTSSQEDTTPPEKPQYRNGLIGNNAATTAASAAFPRLVPGGQVTQAEEKESKSRFKKFKPKNMTLSRDKEPKEKPLASPNKLAPSGLSRVINASTASLADSLSSTNSSLYQLSANPSQTTIIPIPEKAHKHSGLRQKLKLKDKDEHTPLPLSSQHSNSQPVDIDNPKSLYSFAPSSPGPSSGFAKSVSGLDLRHAGRALREKKKEEKAQAKAQAQAESLQPVLSRDSDTSEWPSLGQSTTNLSGTWTPYSTDFGQTLATFGLNNMTPDDAWDFLKAKLLSIFEGEHVRISVEDLNRLVSIYLQRCVQKMDPSIVVGDVEDLLRTGFASLNHTLRAVRDDQLVPHLVGMWMTVFGEILPYMQSVFFPLDQEFKGRGSILSTPAKAAEFWGMIPNSSTSNSALSSSPPTGEASDAMVSAGDELEVRRILLISFRDIVIVPRYDILKNIFSRLSLDSINATLVHLESSGQQRARAQSDFSDRPGTAHSNPLDPNFASYNSQASTLLGGATTSSGGRSRAASNLSNGSAAQDIAFQSFSSPPAARPSDNTSSQVTETVGRMLQCLSVLASVQTGDEAQTKMEELNKQFKLNWLGRGRTGRNRKGFVGTRMRTVRRERDGGGSAVLESGEWSGLGSGRATIRAISERERDGSPTPTPTRQGTVSRQSDDRF